jgi:hypothetical protein
VKLVVESGREHLLERRYTLDVLLGEFLGLEYELVPGNTESVVISSDGGDGRRLIVADLLFAGHEDLLQPVALPRAPLEHCPKDELSGARVLGDVPALYTRAVADGGLVAVEPESVEIGIDLFGGAFVMLTRLEETLSRERDEHDRFPGHASLAVSAGFAARPLVDEYTEILWWALVRLWPRLVRRPDEFHVRPTHDVDFPFYSRGRVTETVKVAIADAFVRGNRSLALARLRALGSVLRAGRDADPCNTFGFLMKESEARSLRSSFYFMSGTSDRVRDPGYSIDDEWIRHLLQDMAGRGHEIGLHPSYRTLGDVAALQRERDALSVALAAAKLDLKPFGGRQHFLRWAPGSWPDWETAGLSYDSSVGFAELCGFRCGTCRDYPAFDVQARRRLRLRERPLIAMETALLTYQGASPGLAADEMRKLRDACRQVGGPFTFLWHNNRLTSPLEREAYLAVLS